MQVRYNKNMVEFYAKSEADTEVIARRIATKTQPRDVIGLSGELGAGKTTFARAFINAFPGKLEEVPSPTFTIVQTYNRNGTEIQHFDLFRLKHFTEAYEIGIEDAFISSISLIEWPDRLGPALPVNFLNIMIDLRKKNSERIIKLYGSDTWALRLLNI